MAWQSRTFHSKTSRYCSHANCKVELRTTIVYPAEVLPEQPPRVNNRTCSHYFDCSLQDKAACTFVVRNTQAAIPVDYI